MFLEPFFKGQRSGWIEVICGSMFSGKTEELLRRIKRAKFANQEVILFKPARDTRYSEDSVVSHDDNSMLSVVVQYPKDMLRIVGDEEVVGIDEAQFFDQSLVSVVQQMAVDGKRIIIAGLDMDFKGEPFGPMPYLLSVAEYITKVHAICPHCGNLATHSYRLDPSEEQVLLGAKDAYEPRCRKCYSMDNILDLKKKLPTSK
jgi:thymidine kinase